MASRCGWRQRARTRRALLLFLLATGSVALLAGRAHATCGVSWDGGGADGLWGTAANWDTDTVPTPTDDVCVTSADVVVLEGTGDIRSLDISNAGATVWIRGTAPGGTNLDAELFSATSITNIGTLRLETSAGTARAHISVTSGSVNNSGVVNVLPGTGGSRMVSWLTNLGGGTVNVNRALSVTTLVNHGTMTVGAGGSIDAFGASVTQAGGTMNLSNGSVVLNLGGTFAYSGGAITGPYEVAINNSNLAITGGAAGLFVVRGASTFNGTIGSAQTVTVEAVGTDTTVDAPTSFVNHGTLNLRTATSRNVQIRAHPGNVTSDGAINVLTSGSGGSRVIDRLTNLAAGTVTLNSRLRVQVLVNQGTLTIGSGGSVDAFGASVTQSGGAMNLNSGPVAVNAGGTFTYSGGTIAGPHEVVVGNSALTITGGGAGLFMLHGTSTFNGTIGSAQTVSVAAIGTNTAVASTGFVNHGTLNLRTADTRTAQIQVAPGTVSNDGVINVQTSGSGGSRSITRVTNLAAGTVTVNSRVGIQHLTNHGTVNVGPGGIDVFGGSVTQAAGTMTLTGGLIVVTASSTFTYSGGSMGGGLPVRVINSTLDLAGGGAGTFEMMATSALTGTIGGAQTVNVTTGGNHTTVTAPSTITNNGVLTVRSLDPYTARFVAPRTINAGTLSVLPSTSTSVLSTRLANGGTFSVRGNATLASDAAHTNTEAVTIDPDVTLRVVGGSLSTHAPATVGGGGTLSLDGAALAATGTLGVHLENVGGSTVAPGASPGIVGAASYAQTDGTLAIEIGGTTPGTGHDQVNVGGAAALGGTLNLSFVGGYAPAPGQTFTIITYGSQTGAFTTVSGPDPVPGIEFVVDTSPSAVTVTTVGPAAPPDNPTSLGQFASDGATAIAAGGSTNDTTVSFSATVTDADAAQDVRLEVEVKPVGAPFNEGSLLASPLVANGGVATVSAPGLGTGGHHWRARAVDEGGATSGWVDFGTAGTDFEIHAPTTMLYNGQQAVTIGGSLTLQAALQSSGPGCVAGQAVTFTLDRDPDGGGASTTSLGSASTNAAGESTVAVTTGGWSEGDYTVAASFAGTAACDPASDAAALTVARAGDAASGGGWYTPPGSEHTQFSFTIRKQKDDSFKGQLTLIDRHRWRLKATLEAHTRQGVSEGAASGTGDLYRWDAALDDGEGAWVLAQAGVTFTISFADEGKGGKKAGDRFGIEITYATKATEPPLPNSTPQPLRGGDVKLS